MKKMKKLAVCILAMLILLTGCSNASTKNYDTTIVDNAVQVTSELGFNNEQDNPFVNGSRNFEVCKTSQNEFSIDVNGTKMIVQTPSDKKAAEYKPKNIKDISSKYDKVCSESKELIYKYIESSETLQNKEAIKEYIKKLSVKEATFTDDNNVGAFFSYNDDCLYINSDNSSYICEWMIVHELVHAISYYTHECNIENEAYCYNIFNEVMTDIITASLNPKIDSSIRSGYSDYYYLVYPYINLFGQQAIEAYFYGYDNIYKNINSDEFDFFVVVIENYGTENSDVYYNNLILKWYAQSF